MNVINLEEYRRGLTRHGYVEWNMDGDRTYAVVVRDNNWCLTIMRGFLTLEAASAVLRKLLRRAAR